MLGIHCYLEDLGWVCKLGDLEDCPAALFGTVTLQLTDDFVLLLGFCELSFTV